MTAADPIDAALGGLPRFPLLAGPTRLQRLARLEARLGARAALFVKRDDEMGVAIGGTKLRGLEFVLGEALAQGADTLVVAGGAPSNQCRLAAAAAAIAGLRCLVLVSDEETPETRALSFLSRLYGAEVRFLGRVDEGARAERAREAAAALAASGARPYLAGDPVTGALGAMLLAGELHAQAPDVRHVFVAGSMGPTEAGFVFGNRLIGAPFAVHLVSVEYGEAELRARLDGVLGGLAARLRVEAPARPGDLVVDMGELGAGYALPTPASEDAILALARAEGLLIEHTYTAKTFAGMLRWAAGSREPAVFVHTGGVPALFGQLGLFRTL
jgi:1-aminocyclopropane-1-carboxylate deaminase/D-cysteine desulfhydrase-like pyridoxal-dependent ACC family enzyme